MLREIKAIILVATASLIFMVGCSTTAKRNDDVAADVYLQLGERYLVLNKLSVAKQNLEKALDIDSSDARTHNSLAFLYEKLHQFSEAEDHYESALDIAPNDVSVQNNYGHFLCERRQFKAGMVLLKRAIEAPLNNRPWLALANAGFCQLNQGNKQQAENYFRQTLRRHNSYAPVLLIMQKLSYESGKFWAAKGFLERYLNVARHTAESLWIATQTERALGHTELMRDYRNKLIAEYPMSKQAEQIKKHIK